MSGKLQQIIEQLQAELKKNPEQPAYYNDLSNAYKKLGNLELAEQYLFESLRLKPNYAASYNNLGSLYYTQGQYKKSKPLFEKALRLQPQYWEAHFNLANYYARFNQMLSAIEHYKEVLKYRPKNLTVLFNLSMAYISQYDNDSAIKHLTTVVKLQSANTEAIYQLGIAHLNLGHTKDAIKYLEMVPKHSDAAHNLGVLYLRAQQRDTALTKFKQALADNPANITAQHMTNALQQQTTNSAPIDYVKNLFDQYAVYYSEHMRDKLNYQVPHLLRQAVGKSLPKDTKALKVLDLGCGTGLCGVFFRDLAQYLVGIDISTEMLLQAKALGAYDLLSVYNLQQAIPGLTDKWFEVIYAGDVLVYLGKLENIFQLCHDALSVNGIFAFTCEQTMDDNQAYVLQENGRYAHNINYIRKLAADFGFDILQEQNIVLREQEGVQVNGLLFLFRFITPS